MKISVIIPVYNEVATVEEIIKRINGVCLDLQKEIIIVDDASTDGTRDIIEKLEGQNIRKVFQPKNQGKGAAIRTGLDYVQGDIVIIQDADLEYHPDEYPKLIEPILNKKADVVYGSRFIGVHRCFLFTHYLGNRVVNLIANILYNTNLTDFMTCYKVFISSAIKSSFFKAKRFGIEAEITGIVFKKNLRVYEVPISYSGRDYQEGKKITWKDFFLVVWWLIYTKLRSFKDTGVDALDKLSYVQKYNNYIFEKFKNYLGNRVLELGAGTGNITRFLLRNRELVVAVDKSSDNLFHLTQRIPNSSIFRTFNYNLEEDSLDTLKEFRFNTVVGINILEHINNDKKIIQNIYQLIEPEGYLILVVPAHRWLFSEFDRLLGHFRRYDKQTIEKLLGECGFYPEKIEHFNSLGTLPWWFNFKVLKRRGFCGMQLFVFNHLVWLVKLFDKVFRKAGISLLVIARKKMQ